MGEWPRRPGRRFSNRIDILHGAEQHARILLQAQNPAKGRGDLAWRKRTSCNLAKQRLEKVMVPAFHQRYVDQIRFQVLGRTKPAEPAAYDHNFPRTAH